MKLFLSRGYIFNSIGYSRHGITNESQTNDIMFFGQNALLIAHIEDAIFRLGEQAYWHEKIQWNEKKI